jgi:hypothetical protein
MEVVMGGQLLGAVVHLGGTGKYVHWGIIQISWSNLIIIGVMILLFLAAIVVPFPRHGSRQK